MQSDNKTVTVRFDIEIPKGYKYRGNSYPVSCQFEAEFTEKEMKLVKRLVAAYEQEANTNMMPMLKEISPELYQRIDKKARVALTEFFWQEAIRNSEGVIGYGEMLRLNYQRDIENGDFIPTKDYKPLFHCEKDVDMAYIEWLERELMCKTPEDRQRFHERYHEDFEGMDVCIDEYICHIPDEFLAKMTKLDCAESQCYMGLVYYYMGKGVPVDYGAARKWFTKAAERGYALAQYNLGVMYHEGNGVTVDYEEARKWYVKAAEQGLADAQNNLGCMYIKGDCLLIDYAEARKWFTKAAEQGLADSQYNLGKMYHLGKGVPIDYEIARKWYSKAIEQGSEEAKEGLRRITENE